MIRRSAGVLDSAACFAGLGVGLALVGERDDRPYLEMPVRAGAAKAYRSCYFGGVKSSFGNEVDAGAALLAAPAFLSLLVARLE